MIIEAKFLFLLQLWFFISGIHCAQKEDGYGDGMSPTNGSICQYPCHPQPTPPLPPPPPPEVGLPAYGAPPPPIAQGNCPPAPVQCCHQYSPPVPYTYYPYGNDSASSHLRFLIKPTSTIWSSVIFSLLFYVVLFHL